MGCKKLQYESKLTLHRGGKSGVGTSLNLSRLARKSRVETGYYYYGARYYNPRISNWLSVDPIALYDPVNETEHYLDGEHNGGYYNPKNMSVYGYTYQNPVLYIDPNGKQSVFEYALKSNSAFYSAGQELARKLNSFSLPSIKFDNNCTGQCNGMMNSEFIGPTKNSLLKNPQNPVDEVDLAALNHDKSYMESGANGIKGALIDNDEITLAADKKLMVDSKSVILGFLMGRKDKQTKTNITFQTVLRALAVIKFFKPVIKEKEARLQLEKIKDKVTGNKIIENKNERTIDDIFKTNIPKPNKESN
jgi:RHS repeat-associated protein